jgi:DNA-binding LacI/PurR family transcriptional regulator
MAKKPTVYDVAERAGVSIATVSFTFTQPHRVREATREGVLKAARELGYLPSASARGLAKGKTGAIGLFSFDYFGRSSTEAARNAAARTARGPGQASHDLESLFSDEANNDFRLFPLYHDEVQRGVEMECRRRGYVLMVGEGHGASTEADIAGIAGRVDGLAVFPNTLPGEILRRISRRIPVVELSNPAVDNGLHRVSVENATGMTELTEHLVQHHGYRDIIFVGAEGSPDREFRFKGFAEVMRRAGLEIRTLPRSGPVDPAGDVDATILRLQAAGELPQAFVCAVDAEALLYMDALARAGLRVPGDVAVTGFDGLVAGLVNRPSLTTVRQPLVALGTRAAAILIDHVDSPSAVPVVNQLPVKLVLRESCGCGS